jgi:hypothetical protein
MHMDHALTSELVSPKVKLRQLNAVTKRAWDLACEKKKALRKLRQHSVMSATGGRRQCSCARN